MPLQAVFIEVKLKSCKRIFHSEDLKPIQDWLLKNYPVEEAVFIDAINRNVNDMFRKKAS
jgi:hypothetical protein